MEDAYGSKLWDILPQETNIAGICQDDTILLDGCRAANIRWKSFEPVAYTSIPSWKRWAATHALRSSGLIFYVAIALTATLSQNTLYGSGSFVSVIGPILLVYSIILLGLSPYLLRLLYLGKFWNTQAWFFGFEGYMDIDAIERQIFGARLNRMEWSVNGSPLSRHYKDPNGECVGLDPTEADPAIRIMVENAKRAMPGDQRVSHFPLYLYTIIFQISQPFPISNLI